MKDLIERAFSTYNPNIRVSEDVKDSDFGLTDTKSCNDCWNNTRYFAESCDDKTVLNIHNTEKVRVICLEKVFQDCTNTEAALGGCCDYLLYSNHKIAVTDLTCSRPEFITQGTKGGKRATAYQQMSDSIEKLQKFDSIADRINQMDSKVAIFAIRKKIFAVEGNEDSPQRSMKAFLQMNVNPAIDMGNGFHFITQEYPQTYTW